MINLTEKEKQIYREKFNHFKNKTKEHNIHKVLAEFFSELCCQYVLIEDYEQAKTYARLFEYADYKWIATVNEDMKYTLIQHKLNTTYEVLFPVENQNESHLEKGWFKVVEGKVMVTALDDENFIPVEIEIDTSKPIEDLEKEIIYELNQLQDISIVERR